MRVNFELTGTMPMLMHADDVGASEVLSEWRKDPANKNMSTPGDDRSPAWTWYTYCYSDGEHVAIPSQNLMVCLRKAATDIILKKQKTFKELSQSGLLIDTEFLDFFANGKKIPIAELHALRDKPYSEQCKAVEKLGFRLWAKRAVIGKAKHVRVRPRFDRWSITGSLEVLAKEISFDVLTQMFDIAGRVGLGDWRPGGKTPGPFGMFTAKLSK